MAADVEGVQRLLEELHRLSREGFPDSEVRKRHDDDDDDDDGDDDDGGDDNDVLTVAPFPEIWAVVTKQAKRTAWIRTAPGIKIPTQCCSHTV